MKKDAQPIVDLHITLTLLQATCLSLLVVGATLTVHSLFTFIIA